jgi:hypothetical protein
MFPEKVVDIVILERENKPMHRKMYSDPCRGRGYSVRREFS